MFKHFLRERSPLNRQKIGLGIIAMLLLSAAVTIPFVQHFSGVHAASTPETAQMADSFVDSICVGVHWSYPDTPYGANYEGVKQMLVASGIRHARGSEHAAELGQLGIKSIYSADVDNNSDGNEQTVQKIVDNLKTAIHNGAVYDAVESSNEPDLFWKSFHKTYKGQGFPEGVIAFQKDLYTALKSDPVTAGLIVIGPSQGVTYEPGKDPIAPGALTNYVDWGNFHPYPGGGNPFSYPDAYDTIDKYYWHGDQPSDNLDEWPAAFDTYAHQFAPKPMAATETGYNTSSGATSELVQGKYMPRLFLEYFRKGVKRTCSYEFVNEWNDPGNPEANFGLLRNDLSPKPAYSAVKNLISVLSDPGTGFTPGSLDYALKVDLVGDYTRTQYVHHLLLQKRDGSFYLVLWHEIADEDVSVKPHREITPPDLPTTITLNTPMSSAQVYALQDNGQMNTTSVNITNNQVHLTVSDKATIVKLTSGNSTVAPSASPTTTSATAVATTAAGATPTPATTTVPVPVLPRPDNVGTSNDTKWAGANFDGAGDSYSAQELQRVGLAPGKTVVANHVTFTWPSAPVGTANNYLAHGQVIAVTPVSGASTLAFLGSASNGPSTGTATVTYTDGSQQTFSLGFSDWTLNAGKSAPAYGNTIVAKTTYRNTPHGKQDHKPCVFYAQVVLQAGKTVRSVTLPSTVSQGRMHIFALGTK